MYALYGKRGSGSASVEVALAIAGLPYRIVETASWDTNDAFEDLLKINPIGQIPTLVLPDGTALSESAAILIHLDSAASGARLVASRRIGACAGHSWTRVHRSQLLFGHHHHRFSRTFLHRYRRRIERAHPRGHACALAPSLGNLCRHVRRSSFPDGRRRECPRPLRGGRIEMVGRASPPCDAAASISCDVAGYRTTSQRSAGIREALAGTLVLVP